MGFDSTDWNASAKRLKYAFGVKSQCRFYLHEDRMYLCDESLIEESGDAQLSFSFLALQSQHLLKIEYSQTGFEFLITDNEHRISMQFSSDGQLASLFRSTTNRHRLLGLSYGLAEGLFNLGLLTPEIEKRLETTPSPRMKLSWSDNCRMRAFFDTLEPNQVARAFGVIDDCRFADSGYAMFLAPVSDSDAIETKVGPETSAGLSVHISYSYAGPSGWLISIQGMGSKVFVDLSFQGDVVHQEIKGPEPQTLALIKGLFHLGLLTPEIENELQMTVTAHEKMEWAKEYYG